MKGNYKAFKPGIFLSVSLALGSYFANRQPRMLLQEQSEQFSQPQAEQPPWILLADQVLYCHPAILLPENQSTREMKYKCLAA